MSERQEDFGKIKRLVADFPVTWDCWLLGSDFRSLPNLMESLGIVERKKKTSVEAQRLRASSSQLRETQYEVLIL